MLQQEVLKRDGDLELDIYSDLQQSTIGNPESLLEKADIAFKDHAFLDMRKSGLLILISMADDYSLLETLKSLILNVEDQIRKYNIHDSFSVCSQDLDLFGLIDTLETLYYVSDYRQYDLKKNKLKRRLSEWAPATYLIEAALKDLLESSLMPDVSEDSLSKLESHLNQYHELRNRMVQANIRLVYSVANRFRYLGVAYEDLVQEGFLGLIKAVERFEVSKGFRFSTYAHIVISQSIHLAIDKQGSLVRLPFKALREKATVDKVRQNLEQVLGHSPTISELDAHLPDELEYKATHISNAVEPNANSQSIYSSPDDSELLEEMSPLDQDIKTSRLSHSDLVNRALARLDERESYIVRMRYGIGLNKEYTLEEISQTVGLSRERIRQLSHHAIEKLTRSFSQGV